MKRNLLWTGAVAATLLVGCGGGGDGDSGDGTDGPADPEVMGAIPPERPDGPAAAGSTATTIAVRKVLLGDTNPDGTFNRDRWMTTGYNLDGIDSTADGSNHCETLPGANPNRVKVDGTDARDNGFGKNLLGVIQSVAPDASPSLNGSLESGDFSILIHLENAGDEDTQSGIRAAVYGGAPQKVCGTDPDPTDEFDERMPCWDGTDVWPVTPETVNGSVDSPNVSFPDSYMVDGTWVSGSRGDIALAITIEGVSFVLDIREAIITMDLTGRGLDGRAVNGVIAGVLNTQELIDQLRQVAGALDEALCAGSTIESIFAQIRSNSDMRSDGTNGDMGVKCDAISVGLGFEGEAVTLGDVGMPVPPKDNPCPNL